MEKIYQLLSARGLTPNQAYVLWSIREGLSPSMINVAMELRAMGQEWADGTNLTGKALSLLMEIDENFKEKRAKNDSDLMGPEFKTKIEQYRVLFPEVKLPSGKYARDASKNLEVNFRWFFKTHGYDWDTILKATEKYIGEYQEKNWEFMRTSKYFIKKQEKNGDTTSDLANYCELIVRGEGESEPDRPVFKEKVFGKKSV